MKGSLLVVLCLTLIVASFAKVQKGNLITDNDWVFLSDFCFDTTGVGNATWTMYLDSSIKTSGLKVLFYDDASDSWPAVYKHKKTLTCEEMVTKATGFRTVEDGVTQVEAFKDTIRPHYWYLALANCGGKINVQYDITFINAGGKWDRQFSFDEQGLPQMYLFFWLVFTIGLAIHIKGIWGLHSTGSYHPIVRLLTASLSLEATSMFCFFIHYVVYKDNGIGAPGLKGLGEIMNMASQLVFILMLLLLAKGWAISKTQITDQKILTVGFCVFLLCYISMFIWENVGRDPASTIYVYESAPGIIILVLRAAALVWFLYSLRNSHLEESQPEKRRFYLVFGSSYTGWFLSLPFVVILAAIFSAWYRLKVVTGMYLCFNTIGLFFLAFLLWPTRARQYFQINRSDMLLGENTMHSSPYETL